MIDSPKDLPAWLQVILAAADSGLNLSNLRGALWSELSETIKQSPEVLRYGSDLCATVPTSRER